MPIGPPEEMAKYAHEFREFVPEAIRHVYQLLMRTIGDSTDVQRIKSLIEGMGQILPPMQFNDENDETLGKRHAFSDAVDIVKKYFIEQIERKGHPPSLDDVLRDIIIQPTYGYSIE